VEASRRFAAHLAKTRARLRPAQARRRADHARCDLCPIFN
jgi:hypothetical protein